MPPLSGATSCATRGRVTPFQGERMFPSPANTKGPRGTHGLSTTETGLWLVSIYRGPVAVG